MEIALLSKKGLRIKGKNAVLTVDTADKSESNALLLLDKNSQVEPLTTGELIINGPGEYETGGIKITGIKQDSSLIYSVTVDGVSVLVGKVTALEKLHTKLKEANILVVNSDNEVDASFLSALVANVIIFYGEKAVEVCKSFGQENANKVSKYTTAIDKLPAEVETVILD